MRRNRSHIVAIIITIINVILISIIITIKMCWSRAVAAQKLRSPKQISDVVSCFCVKSKRVWVRSKRVLSLCVRSRKTSV